MDKRSITSAENGKKGGRLKGSRNSETLKKERLQRYILNQFLKEKKPIIEALMTKAKAGEVQAIKELLDRALGKATESLKFDGQIELSPLIIQIIKIKNDDQTLS